jgi:hypothetical protein
MFVKFGALAIIQSRIIHTLMATICTISLNLLRYTLRQIINLNLFMYIRFDHLANQTRIQQVDAEEEMYFIISV